MTRYKTLLLPSVAVGLFAVAGLAATASEKRPAPHSKAEGSKTAVMTQAVQAKLTPEQILLDLKEGNQRFVEGRSYSRDYLAQARATEAGQYPKAVVLGCLDSRVLPEILFDQGIGDLFVGRVAGNFENNDLLGSLEFGTQVAGAKVIVVLGHTRCGAIKGAADGVKLGHLTEQLTNFDEALAEARKAVQGEYNSSNDEFVRQAIEENVRITVADIVERSEVMADLVKKGELLVVGGVYQLGTGAIEWLDT
jgi:carbonic anhydrase